MSKVLTEADKHWKPLAVKLTEYHDSPQFSDGSIKCADKEYRIHRIILSAQSEFFLKAFDGKWKESETGVISLDDDDPSAVEAMLQFMYTWDYDASGTLNHASSPMVFNVKVYSIAGKYDVFELKSKAKAKFKKSVETCWGMDDFPDAIVEVYKSTLNSDRGLREIVVDVACEHISELLHQPGFIQVLDDTVGFGSDLCKLQAANFNRVQKPTERKFRCPHCDEHWRPVKATGSQFWCPHCSNRRTDWSSYVVED